MEKETTKTQEKPKIFFLVLHKSGDIIFSFPPTKTGGQVVSTLVGVISALEEQLSEMTPGVTSTTLGENMLYYVKNTGVTYSLFVPHELEGDFKGLLLTLIEKTKDNLSPKMLNGVGKLNNDTGELTEVISTTLDSYLKRTPFKEASGKGEEISLPNICKMIGVGKVVKIFRGLLAEKPMVVMGYNLPLVSRILHVLIRLYPENVRIHHKFDKNLLKTKQHTIFIMERGNEASIKENTETLTFLDLDNPLEEQPNNGILFEKISQIPELESKKRRRSIVKSEVSSLYSIIDDSKKILAREPELSQKELREKLLTSHPQDKVKYVLELLVEEKSPVIENLETSEKIVEELFFM